MGFWTISIGPVREVTDNNLKTALTVIVEEVRSYRLPSKVMIARYAQEKRRAHQGEIETFEEIVASTIEEVETLSIALRELATPLMEPPESGPTFHEYLTDTTAQPLGAKGASDRITSSQGSASHA